MEDRDKVVESVDDSAYTNSCRCPKCRKLMPRESGEQIMYCSKCGQKLHLRAFTKEEVDQALFDHEMDGYKD